MTEQQIPKLEDILGAEKLETLKADISKTTNENFQRLLDMLIERFGFDNLNAKVTSEIRLSIEMLDGAPVITNDAKVGIAYTPAVTHDMFEQINRDILSVSFSKLIDRA